MLLVGVEKYVVVESRELKVILSIRESRKRTKERGRKIRASVFPYLLDFLGTDAGAKVKKLEWRK